MGRRGTHLDLLISHAVTDAGVELVQRLPRELFVRQKRSGLNRALERRSPDLRDLGQQRARNDSQANAPSEACRRASP